LPDALDPLATIDGNERVAIRTQPKRRVRRVVGRMPAGAGIVQAGEARCSWPLPAEVVEERNEARTRVVRNQRVVEGMSPNVADAEARRVAVGEGSVMKLKRDESMRRS